MALFLATALVLKHQSFRLVMRWSYQNCFSYFFLKLQPESITYHLLNRKALPKAVPGAALSRAQHGPVFSIVSGRSAGPAPGPGLATCRGGCAGGGGAGRRGRAGGAGRWRPGSGRSRQVSARPRSRRSGGGAGLAARRRRRARLCPRGAGCGRRRASSADSRPLTRLGSPGNGVAAPLPPSPRLCGRGPGAAGLRSLGPQFSQRDPGFAWAPGPGDVAVGAAEVWKALPGRDLAGPGP